MPCLLNLVGVYGQGRCKQMGGLRQRLPNQHAGFATGLEKECIRGGGGSRA